MKIKDAKDCRYDLVSLGECMIRLSPPAYGRIEFAPLLEVWVGGGEYNVSYALARLGLRTGWVGGLNSSPMGAIIRNHARSAGMNVDYVVERKYDGVGKKDRIGLNFTEVGVAKRGSVTLYDRGHTATSGMKPGEVNWKKLFQEDGVRWLHTGGIFAALSESTAQTVIEAVTAAKRHGTVVSYDLNYRPSLWKAIGGQAKAQEVNREIARYIDVMIGNEEDFTASLGFEVEGLDENLSALQVDKFAAMIAKAAAAYPNFKVIGTTMRTVRSASVNDWGAIAWSPATGVVQATHRERLEILDRVGGGDSFASGLIYGLLEGEPLQTAVEYGAAHGALAMTTPGDTTMATKAEVLKLAGGGGARVDR